MSIRLSLEHVLVSPGAGGEIVRVRLLHYVITLYGHAVGGRCIACVAILLQGHCYTVTEDFLQMAQTQKQSETGRMGIK